MRFNGVIQRKLALLDSQVCQLEQTLRDVSYGDFSTNWGLRCIAERALQVSIEIVIDIAERIIAMEGAGPVSTAAEAIERLERMKIIGSRTPYVEMIRFRNVIVHQYEEIDSAILFDLAKNRLSDFRRFRDEIDAA